MKEISFNWTVTAFLSGHKTATRREWKDSYAKTFKKGELVAAYDKQRRFGGKRIGIIKLTKDPYKQSTAELTEDDWYAEGMDVLEGEGRLVDGLMPSMFWLNWQRDPKMLWVVKFKVVH